MQIIVCQMGARHRYAIPRLLEELQWLKAFCTDSSELSLLGRVGRKIGPSAPGFLRIPAERRIVGVPREKIFSTDSPHLVTMYHRLTGKPMSSLDFVRQGNLLSRFCRRLGVENADWLWTVSRLNRDLACHAQTHGVRNVVDVIISPLTERIVREEQSRFPDWSGTVPIPEVEYNEQLWRETFQQADLLLSPSNWVSEGIRRLVPEASGKIQLVPYGCSIDWEQEVNQPEPGKVLFCGGDVLRKGLHYLGRAATILKSLNPRIRIEVAGHIAPEIRQHSVCRNLLFVGKLPLAEMRRQYLTADIFVLPSLSEGFAGVVAEAITAGVPVVVTKESGTGVEDGKDGLVVNARDPEALAAAIQRLVEDRGLRDSMSQACLAQRAYYSRDGWRERLRAAFQFPGKESNAELSR